MNTTLAALPAAKAAFSDHVIIVLGVALAFFLLQVVLIFKIYLRTRRQESILIELRRDGARPSVGRGDGYSESRSFSWLRWVVSIFPTPVAAQATNYSRDDVLAELDSRIAAHSDYLLLQRMGVMAPLLGVILTVVGFYWLRVDETAEQSLPTILLAVTPLVSGVGAGALLALINQALLHAASVRIERLRTAARDWFDAVIWRPAALETQIATGGALAALDTFATSVGGAADRHTSIAAQLDRSAGLIATAAAQLSEVVGAFRTGITGMPEALIDLRSHTAASAEALEELIPAYTRAVSNLDVSVAAFRTTIDHDFTDAVGLQQRSTQAFADSIQQIGDSIRVLARMGEAAEILQQTVAGYSQLAGEAKSTHSSVSETATRLADAGKHLRQLVESDVAPSQRMMHDAANSFSESAARLTEFVERGLGPATKQLASLHQSLAGIQETVSSINKFSHARADIDRLTASLARAAEIADAISALPEQLREILEQTARRQADAVSGRGGLKTWLGTRPR